MHPQTPAIPQSNYYVYIIRNNFQQVQEAYFGTKDIAKEYHPGTKINQDYETNRIK